MTKAETGKLFLLIAAAYPRDKAFAQADEIMLSMWATMLKDVPWAQAEACIQAHIATSPFPPGISDIRGWMAKSAGTGMDGSEAWGKLLATVRKHGYYEEAAARRTLAGPVWEAFERTFGNWQQFCMSENPVADRAHFMRTWEAMEKRREEQALLPAPVQAELAKRQFLLGGAEQ